MDNGKLNEIGMKLEVSEEDIIQLKRRYLLIKILCPIIGLLISMFIPMTIDSVTSTYNHQNNSSYPYAIPFLLFVGTGSLESPDKIKRRGKIIILITAIITLFLSIMIWKEGSFRVSSLYGVFSSKKLKIR